MCADGLQTILQKNRLEELEENGFSVANFIFQKKTVDQMVELDNRFHEITI